MRTDAIQQAVEFLSTKGNLKDQISFLEDKGLSPSEIYYSLLKAGLYVPLKYNYFTSLLLGGGLIFAASKVIEYTLDKLIQPIQETLNLQISKIDQSVDKMQDDLQILSTSINSSVVKVNDTILSNNTQLNDLLIDFQRLETSVKSTTDQQQDIISDLIKEIGHLKSLLSKNKESLSLPSTENE